MNAYLIILTELRPGGGGAFLVIQFCKKKIGKQLPIILTIL